MVPNSNFKRDESSNYTYWPFLYFSIENNDYNKVDLNDFTSPKKLTLTRMKNTIKIGVLEKGASKETFHVKASANQKLEILGLEANVSTTWNTRSIIGSFNTVKTAQYIPEKYKPDSDKTKRWVEHQLKLIKEDDWESHEYVFVVINSRFNGNESETFHIKMVENGK